MIAVTARLDDCVLGSWDFAPVVDLLCDLGLSAAELEGDLDPALVGSIALRLGGLMALEQVVEVERLDLATGQACTTLRSGAGQLLRPCLMAVATDEATTELWWKAHRDEDLYLVVAPMAVGATAVPHRVGALGARWRDTLDAILVAIEAGAGLRVERRAAGPSPDTVRP
jgi:hypothetical protein